MSGPDGGYGQQPYGPGRQSGPPGLNQPTARSPRADPAKLLGLAVAGLGGLNFIWGFLPELNAPRIDADLSVFAVGPSYVPILLLIAGILAMAAFLPGSERSRLAVAAVSVGGAAGAIVSLGAVGPVELLATGQVSKGLGAVLLVVFGIIQAIVAIAGYVIGADFSQRVTGDSQPAGASPGYAQPGYAQPGYAQPEYAQPEYAQPGYAQPGYAQPEYAQPEYAQPEYAKPGYTPPGYAPPGHTPPPAGAGPVGAVQPGWFDPSAGAMQPGSVSSPGQQVGYGPQQGFAGQPGYSALVGSPPASTPMTGPTPAGMPDPGEAVTGPQVVVNPEQRRDGDTDSPTGGVPGRQP